MSFILLKHLEWVPATSNYLTVLVVDGRGIFLAVLYSTSASHVSSRMFLKTLTDDDSVKYCGNLFHSVWKKWIPCCRVLHLGLKSFFECPVNLCVSKQAEIYSPFRWVFGTLQSSPHVVSACPTNIFPVVSVCLHVNFVNPLTSLVALFWICLRQSLCWFVQHDQKNITNMLTIHFIQVALKMFGFWTLCNTVTCLSRPTTLLNGLSICLGCSQTLYSRHSVYYTLYHQIHFACSDV